MRWWPAAVLLLLALPFHPFWLDYEAARRGLLMVGVGLIALLAWRWRPPPPGPPTVLWLALAGWHLVRCIGVANPGDGVSRAGYLLALGGLFWWARRSPAEAWLRAAVPVTLAVSLYGLLQALGVHEELRASLWGAGPDSWSAPMKWLQSLLSQGQAVEPVSTLGNRNVAAELTAVGGASAAALLVRGDRTRWPWLALTAAGIYLVVNGSRSGLLALPLGIVVVLAQPGVARRRRTLVLSAALAGLALGLLAHLARPAPSVEQTTAAAAAAAAPPSTIEVRLAIWRSCASMVAERPFTGQGSAQFKVEYPRFRSEREIDLSSTGVHGPRSFRASPSTAHNDHLELLVETGIPGLLLAWAFGLSVLVIAARGGPAAFAPLLAFTTLTLVRSPLANAPAAALVFGYAGALSGRRDLPAAARSWTLLWTIAGAAMLFLGAATVATQTLAASYLAGREFPSPGDARVDALSAAIATDVAGTSALRSLRLQETVNRGGLNLAEATREDAAALAKWAPHSTGALLLRANVARGLGNYPHALALLRELRALDPRDPEAQLMEASIYMVQGDPARVIATLYDNPHPRLRAELAANMALLANEAERRGRDPAEVLLFRSEAAFLVAIDESIRDPASPAAQAAATQLAELMQQSGIPDVRGLLLLSIHALAIDDPESARRAGAAAQRMKVGLAERDRELLGGLEQQLAGIPEWAAVLRRH